MRIAHRLLILLLAVGLLTTGAAGADTGDPVYEPGSQTLFAHWDGCGADTITYLAEHEPETFNGCGFIGGAPLNTVFDATGDPAVDSFPAQSGITARLDGSGQITGQAAAYSWTGVTGAGVGAVTIEAALTARRVGSNQTIQLGTAEDTFIATPADDFVVLDFTFDIDDSLDEVEIRTVTLDLNVHGAFVDSGVVATGGLTQLTLPTLVEVEPEPEPTPVD